MEFLYEFTVHTKIAQQNARQMLGVGYCFILYDGGHFITAFGPVQYWFILKDCKVAMYCNPEAEFLDVIGTKKS